MTNTCVEAARLEPSFSPTIPDNEKNYRIKKVYQMQRLCPDLEHDPSQTRQLLFYTVVKPAEGSQPLLIPAQYAHLFISGPELEEWYVNRPCPEELKKDRGKQVLNNEQAKIRHTIGFQLREMCLRPIPAGTEERATLDRADKAGAAAILSFNIDEGWLSHAYLGFGRDDLLHHKVIHPNPKVHWVEPARRICNRVKKGRIEKSAGAGNQSSQTALLLPEAVDRANRAQRAQRRAAERESRG